MLSNAINETGLTMRSVTGPHSERIPWETFSRYQLVCDENHPDCQGSGSFFAQVVWVFDISWQCIWGISILNSWYRVIHVLNQRLYYADEMAVTGAMALAPHPALQNKVQLIGDVFIVVWMVMLLKFNILNNNLKCNYSGLGSQLLVPNINDMET